MAVYATPDQTQVQAKAQADLDHLASRIRQLTTEGYDCHVQISYTPMSIGCTVGQSFNFPAGSHPRMPRTPQAESETASHWQAKDNAFREGYDRGCSDGQNGHPYSDLSNSRR